MNQAKLKTYPMQTTLAIPGAVRLPNTLHEHFRSDPFECATYPAYCILRGQFDTLETYLAKWHDTRAAMERHVKDSANVAKT